MNRANFFVVMFIDFEKATNLEKVGRFFSEFGGLLRKYELYLFLYNYSLISRFCSSNRVQGMRSTGMDCESAPMDVSRFQTQPSDGSGELTKVQTHLQGQKEGQEHLFANDLQKNC